MTKEEAEEVASDEREWRRGWKWVDVALTKDASTAARIAGHLEKVWLQ